MINAGKQVEFQFKRSKKMYFIIFSIAVILYSICGCKLKLIKSINDPSIYIANKLVFEAIALSTFIIGTYALYYSMAYIMIYIKDKCTNFKYEYTNLFLIGSIVSKLKLHQY